MEMQVRPFTPFNHINYRIKLEAVVVRLEVVAMQLEARLQLARLRAPNVPGRIMPTS